MALNITDATESAMESVENAAKLHAREVERIEGRVTTAINNGKTAGQRRAEVCTPDEDYESYVVEGEIRALEEVADQLRKLGYKVKMSYRRITEVSW